MPSVHVPSHLLEICKDAKTVAQQLTHIELDRLKFIGPEEFMKGFLKGYYQSSQCFSPLFLSLLQMRILSSPSVSYSFLPSISLQTSFTEAIIPFIFKALGPR